MSDPENTQTAIYADPSKPKGVTKAIWFKPGRLVDENGKVVLPLFKDAINFWKKHIGEVEIFQTSKQS